MKPRSRRDLFRLAGLTAAGGSVVFLSACAADKTEEENPLESPAERDVRLLNTALDLEYTAIAAYTAGVALLRGRALAAGKQFLGHEQEHAAALTKAIRDLGGTPKQPLTTEEYAQGFPNLKTQRDVLHFAVDLENKAVKAYVDSIPRLSTDDLRQTGAAIASNEAEHISVLLGTLNPGDPAAQVPEAFVTGVESVTL